MNKRDRKEMLNNVRKSGYAFEYRITIFGDKETGKTSILNRYMNSTFTHRYRPTVEDHVTHIIEHNGAVCVCLFIDTSGGNDFPAMRRLEISKGNDFFIVYAIDNKRSFEFAKSLLAEICEIKKDDKELKIILIGTKTDLEDDRKVSYSEGRALVNDLKEQNVQSQFFEVGAKDDNNVENAFKGLFDMYIPNEIITPGKNSLPRKSIRRKKNDRAKQKTQKFELTRNVPSFSDTDINLKPTSENASFMSGTDLRCNSVSPKSQPRSHAKHFIQRTFGNMQRILGSQNNNDKSGLTRSNTYDCSMSSSSTAVRPKCKTMS